jgi:hypothetical protein
VNDKTVDEVADLIEDCWRKSGAGADIMPSGAHDMNLCVVCGSVEAKGEIENFREKVLKELNKSEFVFDSDTQTTNLNEALFKSNYLPDTLEKGDKMSVFYYIEKPYISPDDIDAGVYVRDVLGRNIRNIVGGSSTGAILNSLFLNDVLVGKFVDTYSGVLITKRDDLEKEDFDNVKHRVSYYGCYLIVPYDNYD